MKQNYMKQRDQFARVRFTRYRFVLLSYLSIALGAGALAQPKPLSVAVLNFDVSSPQIPIMGGDVALLLTTQLSSNSDLLLADRVDIDKALGEQAMGISGTVDAASAAKIGKITGVQIIVSGRVFRALNETLLVSKIMSTENGRVFGEMVTLSDNDSMAKAVTELGAKIDATLSSKGKSLVVDADPNDDYVGRLKAIVQNKKLPSVTVVIPEVSLGAASIDPAAATEFQKLLTQLGFTVFDSKTATGSPDVEITGEAVSQVAFRKGGLVSARGRVEVKAVEKTSGKILWTDSENTVAVDISDEIASKTALQKGSHKLIERMVTQLLTH